MFFEHLVLFFFISFKKENIISRKTSIIKVNTFLLIKNNFKQKNQLFFAVSDAERVVHPDNKALVVQALRREAVAVGDEVVGGRWGGLGRLWRHKVGREGAGVGEEEVLGSFVVVGFFDRPLEFGVELFEGLDHSPSAYEENLTEKKKN